MVKKKPKEKRKRGVQYEDVGDDLDGPWAPVPPVSVGHTESDVCLSISPATTSSPPGDITATAITDTAPSAVVKEDMAPDPTLHIVEPDEEEEMWEKVNERKIAFTLPPRPARGSQIGPVCVSICLSVCLCVCLCVYMYRYVCLSVCV